MDEVIKYQELEHKVAIFWPTYDFPNDPYSGLYFGWIQHLFSLSNVYTLVFDFDIVGVELLESVVYRLPSKSIIVCLMNAEMTLVPKTTAELRKSLGLPEVMLIHLSHEMPWIEDINDLNGNGIFGNNTELLNAYSMYKAVFRQYYYKPLQLSNINTKIHNPSFDNVNTIESCMLTSQPTVNPINYIPLGPTYYGYKIGGYRQLESQNNPIQFRTRLCFISGRFNYPFPSIYHNDRLEIQKLIDEGNFKCDYYQGVPPTSLVYQEYMNIMNDTIFVPCPAGNNPETFRHYEALEIGCIPIILDRTNQIPFIMEQQNLMSSKSNHTEYDYEYDINKEKEKYYDFLYSEFWQSYPGPKLTNWSGLNLFLELSLQNLSSIVEFHQVTQKWYKKQKLKMKLNVKRVIDHYYFTNEQ